MTITEKLARNHGDYAKLDNNELRRLIRERKSSGELKIELSGTQIVGLTKADCISLLEGSTPAAPAPASPAPASDLAAMLAAAIEPFTKTPALDEARVLELIAQHAPKQQASTLRIQVGEMPEREIPRQHKLFPALLACVSVRVPAYLAGPAGSGKTSAAAAAANACGLSFGALSVGPTTSKADLFGFIDANGVYRETELVRAFRDGGVFLLDEIDAGHAGIMTQINMLAANEQLSAPCGMIQKHSDFVLIAAANTYGSGASRQYVGRNQLDAATLDRFAFLEWSYDAALEASFIGVDISQEPFELSGISATPEEWFKLVQQARAKAQEFGMRVVISPRATIYGVRLLAAGVCLTHVGRWLIQKGLTADEYNKLI